MIVVVFPRFLDYERANSTDLVVRCVDAGGLRASSTLTVAVVDSNDPPRIETQNFVVSESVAPGGSVGVINVTDQDTLQNQPWLVSRPPQTLSAQVVGATAASQFGFQGLNLTVRTALDFEVVSPSPSCHFLLFARAPLLGRLHFSVRLSGGVTAACLRASL